MSIQKSLQKIIKMIKERDTNLEEFFQNLHPSDFAEIVDDLTDEQKAELFDLLSDEEAAMVIQEMEELDQVVLFQLLTKKRASAILKEMASDDAADLLSELPENEARELLTLIDEDAEELRGLMKYPEDTAGGIMTTEYIAFPENMTVEEAIRRLREIAPEAETVYYVYVVTEEMQVSGVLSLRELIASADGTKLAEIMRKSLISVPVDMDQEEVARLVSKYDLLAVPVVDERQRLLGIVTVDDILDVLEEEATEDMYRRVGAAELESVDLVSASVPSILGRRLPWLIITLIGGLFVGSVIAVFEEALEAVAALVFFIPVIMDMGGNVATQSSTVFVRGVATGEISVEERWGYFMREIRIGVLMGVICGSTVAVAASFWQGDPMLGLVVGIAMSGTVTVAAIIGTLIPLVFSQFGIDPAYASGPLVTTIKDATGLLIYFSIAIRLLPELVNL
ncbi:magnesium transporter [Dethiobacter alkaliphilus]|uniref:Magnesium transporter MgtE n=1 Tax=Dethiobacter alkaliphilus AHT 1 TaxID=555088 RepID=C0GFV0_DETAL|nr:magnesium transporter [Dethiobacter alkaliphilus]EEG77639.1 magnesium transporter [Dethiobacter alkaliphilus AHT 1]